MLRVTNARVCENNKLIIIARADLKIEKYTYKHTQLFEPINVFINHEFVVVFFPLAADWTTALIETGANLII